MGNNTSSSKSAAAALAGCTKSTILAVPDTETGSHVLTVDGYTRTKGLGAGKSINSGTFTVGGHTWYIAYYPDGFSSNLKNKWISVFVYLDEPSSLSNGGGGVVKVRFDLNLLMRNGEPTDMYKKRSPVLSFSGRGPHRWGFDQFIRKKELVFLYDCVRNNSFQIRCDVTVIRENRVRVLTSGQLVVPPVDLHRHLGNLLENQVGADVTFDVGGEQFMAHKALLAARSSVFKAELFGHMKEKATSLVQIDDMDPNVFGAMLHFIYTDSLPKIDPLDTMVMSQHLLVAADRYNLERLKSICEGKLCGYVETKTVVTMLLLADQHGCKCLEEECVKFVMFRGNMKTIMASDDFEHLVRSYPNFVKEVLFKVGH
jgi:speckle-type POZ protein